MFDFTVKLKLSFTLATSGPLGVGTLGCKGKGPFDSWQGHRKIF